MLFQSKTDNVPSAHDRRNRMAGLWAAELLGLLGHAARDYAHDLAHAHAQDHDHDGDGDGDEKLIQRLGKDLRGKVDIHEIREKLSHLLQEARRQLHPQDKDKH